MDRDWFLFKVINYEKNKLQWLICTDELKINVRLVSQIWTNSKFNFTLLKILKLIWS